ncbi:DFP domain-containing protein [Haematococcus lacustris]|uniref:DFP domain-containing protein n=1 Tax=Haematococcus lacustris TaxID=44745 RepID=A0A6A0A1A9_HAELA|nr:DFP domain-containing protein [Haematococcus lacustris]
MASASGHITDVSLASDYPDSEFEGALAVAAAEAKHTTQPQPGSQLVALAQPLPLVLVLPGSEVSLDILQTAEVATLSAGAADQLGFCEAEVFDLAMGAALTMQRRAVGRPWQLLPGFITANTSSTVGGAGRPIVVVTSGAPTGQAEDITPLLIISSPAEAKHVRVVAAYQQVLADSLSAAVASDQTGVLLSIPFETIFDYLQVLFYLAAAVSDFYLPWAELAEHKIQSSEGGLDLQLRKRVWLSPLQSRLVAGELQVPKMLGLLTRQWCPAAMVVSFKLETDTHILVAKASAALQAYGVHAVVANLLETRKDRVLLVTRAGSAWSGAGASVGTLSEITAAHGPPTQAQQGCGSDVCILTITRSPEHAVIEQQVVEQVVAMHAMFRAEVST